MPPISATSTSQNAARSASRCPGALEFCACCTRATICASAVSAPTLVARTRSVPEMLTDAADHRRRPGALCTGRLSPVTIDSSTSDSPSSTTPSTGIFDPGPDQQQVPDLRPRRWGPRPRAPSAEHHRPGRGEVEQGADGVVGAAAGAHLEPVPEQHERGQHRGGLVEHLAATGQGHPDAVQPAGADRDGDQHHHVQRAGPQRPVGAVEEDPRRVEDHRQRQQQREHVVAQPERRRHGEPEHLPADRRPQQDRAPTAPRRPGTGCACRATMSAIDIPPPCPPWPIASCGAVTVGRIGAAACAVATVGLPWWSPSAVSAIGSQTWSGHGLPGAVVAAVAHPVAQLRRRRCGPGRR